VFSRDPSPGRAKTRLQPRLGAWRAAQLHRRLTERALRTALAAGCGAVELHGTPRPRTAFFDFCAARFGVRLRAQAGEDLGMRMYRALSGALRRYRAVVLIGSDCPALSPRDLRQAARFLQGVSDVVLAPAEDGGYALIGARRVTPELFRGVSWGGPRVYDDTVARLGASGLRWRALRTVWDVDLPEDLERFRALPPCAAYRPRAAR
jgi:rSAM/selenodomain-associated transferase 1